MNPENQVKLTEIFRTIFDDTELVVTDEMTAADIPRWDSLNHINLIMQVEAEFDIQFASTEVAKLDNVKDLKMIIGEKLQ